MAGSVDVVGMAEARAIETSEGVMRPLLFGAAVSVIHLEVPAGIEVGAHGHPREGILYCLSGELELTAGGRTIGLEADTAVRVPADEKVGMRNPGAGPAMALLISSPPAAGSAEELEAHIKALTSAHAGEPSNESGNNQ